MTALAGNAWRVCRSAPDDEELREAMQTMLLHLLRVPSGPREQPVIRGDEELRGPPGR